MRSISFVLLILMLLIGGCSGGSQTKKEIKTMLYDFNEPFRFPFEVNEVRTEVQVDNIDVIQQFIFHYKNKQTTQEIRYILSKVINQPEKLSNMGTSRLELKTGKVAYYDEDKTSQSIWWEGENGFLARFYYYINGNMEQLDDNNKLQISELIELTNQVQ